MENWVKVKENLVDRKNNHSLVFNTEGTPGVRLHLETNKYQRMKTILAVGTNIVTLFSVDQKTLSPIAETFLLCGNVYLGKIFRRLLLVPIKFAANLSFGQNQGSARSR